MHSIQKLRSPKDVHPTRAIIAARQASSCTQSFCISATWSIGSMRRVSSLAPGHKVRWSIRARRSLCARAMILGHGKHCSVGGQYDSFRHAWRRSNSALPLFVTHDRDYHRRTLELLLAVSQIPLVPLCHQLLVPKPAFCMQANKTMDRAFVQAECPAPGFIWHCHYADH